MTGRHKSARTFQQNPVRAALEQRCGGDRVSDTLIRRARGRPGVGQRARAALPCGRRPGRGGCTPSREGKALARASRYECSLENGVAYPRSGCGLESGLASGPLRPGRERGALPSAPPRTQPAQAGRGANGAASCGGAVPPRPAVPGQSRRALEPGGRGRHWGPKAGGATTRATMAGHRRDGHSELSQASEVTWATALAGPQVAPYEAASVPRGPVGGSGTFSPEELSA